MAEHTFHGGAGLYGVMSSVLGVGALTGGMFMAGRGTSTDRTLVIGSLAAGVTFLAGATAPTLPLEMIALFLMGVTSCVLAAATNSTMQLRSSPTMRGRVMALYVVGTVGTRPVGGPIVGWAGQHLGARAGLGVSGASVFVGLALWWIIKRSGSAATGDERVIVTPLVDAGPALGT